VLVKQVEEYTTNMQLSWWEEFVKGTIKQQAWGVLYLCTFPLKCSSVT